MTSFGTAAGQELTTILGRHTGAETVLVDALTLGRLKRSFHCHFI